MNIIIIIIGILLLTSLVGGSITSFNISGEKSTLWASFLIVGYFTFLLIHYMITTIGA